MLPGQPKHTQFVYENCSSSLCVLLARLSRSNMCSQVSKGKDGEAEAPVKKKVVYSRKKGLARARSPRCQMPCRRRLRRHLTRLRTRWAGPQALCGKSSIAEHCSCLCMSQFA